MLLLPETLTAAEAEDVLRLARQAVARETGAELQVDAGALRRFDSSALAVLLETRRLAAAWGKGCQVRGLPPALVELAGLYGVDGLLALAPAEASPA